MPETQYFILPILVVHLDLIGFVGSQVQRDVALGRKSTLDHAAPA
jgi:hypothetical protein